MYEYSATVRVDIYARLSRFTEDQTSTRRQITDCRKVAEVRGATAITVHEDVDFSAYKAVERPGFEALKRRVEGGLVDTVVFWKLDRLARNTREFLAFVDLCERSGVALVSVNEPLDTSSPIGRVIITILAAFAELESATIGLRVRSARDYAAKAGKPKAGGQRMFGYTHQMVQVPAEAKLIRDAADRLLRGESAHTIAREWNEASVSDRYWDASKVTRLLRRPSLAGLRVHRGELVGEGEWEPIITRAEHEALNGRKKAPVVARRRYLLTGGLVRCVCGAPMAGTLIKGVGRYRCLKYPPHNGCGRVSILAEPTEDAVRELVLTALEQPEMRAAVSRQAGNEDAERLALKELGELETRLTELGAEYAKGKVPLTVMTAASQEIEREAEALRRQLNRLGERTALAGVRDVRAEWDQRDLTWRNRLTRAVLQHVEVAATNVRGGPYSSDRLTPVWVS